MNLILFIYELPLSLPLWLRNILNYSNTWPMNPLGWRENKIRVRYLYFINKFLLKEYVLFHFAVWNKSVFIFLSFLNKRNWENYSLNNCCSFSLVFFLFFLVFLMFMSFSLSLLPPRGDFHVCQNIVSGLKAEVK